MLTLGRYETGVLCWGCSHCYWHIPLMASDGRAAILDALEKFRGHSCGEHRAKPEEPCTLADAQAALSS